MKKFFIIFMLGLSTIIFSKEKYIYEVIPIPQNLKNIRVVRILEGGNTGLYGVVTLDGEFLTEPNKILISVQKNHMYLVDVNYDEGLMALDGKWIAEMGKYNYKETYSNMYKKYEDEAERDLFIIYLKDMKKYKYGYINCNGDVQIPIIFDAAKNFSEGLAGVKLNGKWGYIDEEGNVKIGFNFDEANEFKKGLALVRIEDKYFYIDNTGQKRFIRTLFRNAKEGVDNLGHHIGKSFEGKLRLKAKTN